MKHGDTDARRRGTHVDAVCVGVDAGVVELDAVKQLQLAVVDQHAVLPQRVHLQLLRHDSALVAVAHGRDIGEQPRLYACISRAALHACGT